MAGKEPLLIFIIVCDFKLVAIAAEAAIFFIMLPANLTPQTLPVLQPKEVLPTIAEAVVPLLAHAAIVIVLVPTKEKTPAALEVVAANILMLHGVII